MNYTVTAKCRIMEGVSVEDIMSGDAYEYGYEVVNNATGDIIYEFCDRDIANEYRNK